MQRIIPSVTSAYFFLPLLSLMISSLASLPSLFRLSFSVLVRHRYFFSLIQTEPFLRIPLRPRALLPYSLLSSMSPFSCWSPEDIYTLLEHPLEFCILSQSHSVSLSLPEPFPCCHCTSQGHPRAPLHSFVSVAHFAPFSLPKNLF